MGNYLRTRCRLGDPNFANKFVHLQCARRFFLSELAFSFFDIEYVLVVVHLTVTAAYIHTGLEYFCK